MKINLDKCKVLTDLYETIKIEGEHLENVAHFVYLCSSVPDTVKDIGIRKKAVSTGPAEPVRLLRGWPDQLLG